MTVPGQVELSSDGRYRYWLARQLGPAVQIGDPAMVFIMLNPSTATDVVDDPTIRRCMGFARREGYRLLEVVNLYAMRTTRPVHLVEALAAGDPVGPDNNRHIMRAVSRAGADGGLVVAAWGAPLPALRWRAEAVAKLLDWMVTAPMAYCLGTTAAGWPRHPLYVRGDTPLTAWRMP